MKALIVYASWFGHNRALAEELASELRRSGFTVACAPASRVRPADTFGCDLLVLGTYTHIGHASRRLRTLCENIPQQRLDRLAVAVFGTRMPSTEHPAPSCGVEELADCLAARGAELVTAPLCVELQPGEGFRPSRQLRPDDIRAVKAFATELWEAVAPEPVLA